MIVRQFSSLRCPFCQEHFSSVQNIQYWPTTHQVRFGVLRCHCDAFPIIEGVVVLRRGLVNSVAEIERAKQHQRLPAALLLLRENSELRLLPRRVLELLVRVTLFTEAVLPAVKQRFKGQWWQWGLRVLAITTPNHFLQQFFGYFGERDRRSSYVVVASILAALKKARCVVEVGAGAGHLVRKLTQGRWQGTVFSLDKKFWLTYWLACCGQWPAQVCPVVVDAESMLPLQSGMADVVMANDTLMYVDHQRYLLNEMARVCKPEGIFCALHVHLAGQLNIAQGTGMHPKQLQQWVGMRYHAIWDDRQLFTQLWQQQAVRADLKAVPVRLAPTATSFSLIASRKKQQVSLGLASVYPKDQLNYVEDAW